MAEFRQFYASLTIIIHNWGMREFGETGADAFVDLKVDASLYKLAAVFGPVAFPPGMPDYLQNAILDAAERERNAEGSPTLENRLSPSEKERREQASRADLAYLEAKMEEVREREREAWAQTQSTVGGVTMTGEEWAKFAERLKNDEELHRRIVEAFEARGMSEQEAERRYERISDIATIAAKPEAERTESENERLEKANADPSFHQDMKDANRMNSMDHAAGPSGAELKTDSQPPALASTNPQTQPSVAVVNGPAF